MGDAAELYQAYQDELWSCYVDKIWPSQTGDIPIHELKDSHILNILKRHARMPFPIQFPILLIEEEAERRKLI